VTLASSLTGGRLLRTRCCVEILFNLTRDAEDFPCEAFWEVLFKLPRTILRMLLVGLVKRLSVEKCGKEVGSRASMVFITVVAHPLSLYTLQVGPSSPYQSRPRVAESRSPLACAGGGASPWSWVLILPSGDGSHLLSIMSSLGMASVSAGGGV